MLFTQQSTPMDDAIKEKLRLDTLHDEELLRIRKTQEQEREHIVRTQAQAREHLKLTLDLEHHAIHDAAIARQKALNEQNYEHRERLLKLERQYASSEIALKPNESVPESENAGSRNEAAVDTEERFTEPESAGSGNEDSGERASMKGKSKVEFFVQIAKNAAERGAERRRG